MPNRTAGAADHESIDGPKLRARQRAGSESRQRDRQSERQFDCAQRPCCRKSLPESVVQQLSAPSVASDAVAARIGTLVGSKHGAPRCSTIIRLEPGASRQTRVAMTRARDQLTPLSNGPAAAEIAGAESRSPS